MKKERKTYIAIQHDLPTFNLLIAHACPFTQSRSSLGPSGRRVPLKDGLVGQKRLFEDGLRIEWRLRGAGNGSQQVIRRQKEKRT